VTLTRDTARERWLLHLDRRTSLVLSARFEGERLLGTEWRPVVTRILDRFRYNVPAPDSLFDTQRHLEPEPVR